MAPSRSGSVPRRPTANIICFRSVSRPLTGERSSPSPESTIALRKGEDALKAELNGAIKAIRANGTYKTLNDKSFAKFNNLDVYGK